MALPTLFARPTFCGASVVDISTTIGWNQQSSSLSVKLVVDPLNGDVFSPPPVGTPVYFQFYGFRFFGLLQRWIKHNAPDGLPTYEVICTDPREILDAVKVIVRDYNGPTNTVVNLLNVYGFVENSFGFGAAQVNDTGMPWYLVLQALLTMCNQPFYGPYGGPLTYRGFAYSLDLSGMPMPPNYYRIPSSGSLLQIISEICNDAQCDFFVELVGFTIRVRVVSRYAQPPLGTIDLITNTNWGNAVQSSQSGVEMRSGEDEITGSFLVGGQQSALFLANSTSIQPFWGLDLNGNPIATNDLNDTTSVPLNATTIADIIGASLTYNCSILEMRCALHSAESWDAYIAANRPDISLLIGGIAAPVQNNVGKVVNNAPGALGNQAPEWKGDGRDNVLAMVNDAFGNPLFWRRTRLYQFVYEAASQFMGKKFLVQVPFTLFKQVSQTFQIVASQEPDPNGAWIDAGFSPLGLSAANEDMFTNQDGRFRCFAFYGSAPGAAMPNGAIVQSNGIYAQADIDTHVYLTPTPAVLVSLQNPIYAATPNLQATLALAVQANQGQIAQALAQTVSGHLPGLGITASAIMPDSIAVPLKSNILTYGPWYVQGPPGRVDFIYDPTLTPWEYGGTANMNLAGMAKVQQKLSFMQVGETGSIELVGTPSVGLGDTLMSGGPNVTNINIGYGSKGVTTRYEFRTWTPKPFLLSKGTAERIKRAGALQSEMRKAVRFLVNNAAAAETVALAASIGQDYNDSLRKSVAKVFRPGSPHEMWVGNIASDGSGNYRSPVSAMTMEEAFVASQANNDSAYQQTAVMSVNGLLRPFSTSPLASGISHFSGGSGIGVTYQTYNPVPSGQHDIECLAWGNTYPGMHAYRRGNDTNNTRLMALRGPLMVSGWGYGIDGTFYPNVANYAKRADAWPAGPVDLLWDDYRGVWTPHDGLLAILPSGSTLGAGGTQVQVWSSAGDTGKRITAYNWFNTAVMASKGNLKLALLYVATDNKWYVIATDCQ